MKILKKTGEILRHFLPIDVYRFFRGILLLPKLSCRFRKIKKKKKKLNQIVVMGDSHSRFFVGALPETEIPIHFDKNGVINYNFGEENQFCSFDLGPALAYNLNKRKTTIRALEKYEWLSKKLVKKGEAIIFAFGEIDLRAHVYRHVTNSKPFEDVVDKLCDNYEDFLKSVEFDGYYPIVWGPVASQRDEWKQIANNPVTGSECDRNKATQYFNIQMHERCKMHGWGFFSIFDSLIDDEYFTKGEYFCDMCHLGENAKPLFEKKYMELVAEKKI